MLDAVNSGNTTGVRMENRLFGANDIRNGGIVRHTLRMLVTLKKGD
jgi:hypothetical protein